ncbi:MAG TPA: hypothetical protein VF729_06980 [Solirubrobacterales bacterium]
MNLNDRSDPTLMLLIFIGALTAAAWSFLSDLRPDAILSAVGSLAPLALGAFGLASALAIQRLVSTNRTLRSRRTLAVVPADDFDPEPDAVLRFAAELGAIDRSVLGWIDRRASAVRVTLTGDAEGRLVYLVSAPERSFKFLQGALAAYEGVELRKPDEVLGKRPTVDDLATHRTELVLARNGLEPLARLSLDPDPLRPFATALGAISPEAGEELSVCIDLLPATGWRRTRLRKRLQRLARRRYGERRTLREVLDGPQRGRGRPGPDQLLERRLINEALDAKLRDSGSLFELQALVRCRARNRDGAKAAMHRVLGAFAPFAAQNWFRARGLPVPGLGFLGSDLPLRRRGFDRRMNTGLFRPGRRAIVTASEMAGLLKPPNVHCNADNVARAGTLLGAPPKLPPFEDGKADLIPLGRIGANGSGQIVGVRAADTFFSYIAGRSRYGKTELAVAQFVHVVRSGHGGLFLDPHGDALERIKPYLGDPALRGKVVEINLGPGHRSTLPGWNLFELGGDADGEERVEAIVDAFSSALEWGERSSRAINLTTQAATALVSAAKVLPDELAPTIFQLPTLLSDERWRETLLPFLPRASQRFWEHRFPLLAAEAVTPLTNLVDRLRAMPTTTTLLGQSESTYRVREAMDEGQIVLVCPGSGGARDRLIANLIVFDLLHTARRRAELAPAGRKPFWVFLDEVQSFDGGASGSLAGLLEQSAKFGLRAVLLNQNPERLSPQTLNALTTNRSHLLATALNSHAASLLTKEWGGELNSAVMARLPRYRFVAQVTHEGELSRPFALRGIRVEDVHGEPEPSDGSLVPEAARRSDPAAVIDHLETLDERIQTHLEELEPPPGPDESGDGEEDDSPREPLWLDEGSDGR